MSGLFNEASLVLVPSGYKSGKVYSEVPTDGDGDLTFTRASSATRVNSDGEIEVVGSGVPRLDYSQGSCPALLLEPQRTNLVLYSEQFDNAAWSKDNVTVTANTATSPDGTQNADTIDDSSASFGSISQLFVSLTNATYTFSVFVKAVSTATNVRLDLYTAVGDQFFVVFNSATGAYVTGNGGVYASTAFNNGWFRFTLTATGSGNTNVRVYPSAQSAASTGAVYVWGAQLE
jgi:hypothetical protein